MPDPAENRRVPWTRHLADMTWPEVAEAVATGSTTVILPLGATEQHGPHLPLATDSLRAAALAERLAALLPDVLVAPVLPLGCSDEHAGFAGLLGLDAETLAGVIVHCAQRMAAWGVRRLVLLSAHGGNGQALALARSRLARDLPELAVCEPGAGLGPAEAVRALANAAGVTPEALGLHAGEWETSEILSLFPEAVRTAEATAGYTGEMGAVPATLRAVGLRPVTPNGVLGDPTGADGPRGARYLDAVARQIADEVQRWGPA
jgi:creatinine amidohydrolase